MKMTMILLPAGDDGVCRNVSASVCIIWMLSGT